MAPYFHQSFSDFTFKDPRLPINLINLVEAEAENYYSQKHYTKKQRLFLFYQLGMRLAHELRKPSNGTASEENWTDCSKIPDGKLEKIWKEKIIVAYNDFQKFILEGQIMTLLYNRDSSETMLFLNKHATMFTPPQFLSFMFLAGYHLMIIMHNANVIDICVKSSTDKEEEDRNTKIANTINEKDMDDDEEIVYLGSIINNRSTVTNKQTMKIISSTSKIRKNVMDTCFNSPAFSQTK